MAYACPVCETLAPDGEHLAHHLAIVAMTRGGEHETWLDEHAEGWGDASPDELADIATKHAEAVDHELADASAGEHPDLDDYGDGHGHSHGHGTEADRGRGARSSDASGLGDRAAGADRSTAAGDEETAAVLAEAREITQRMLGEEEASGDGAETANDDGAETTSDGEDDAGEAPADESAETDSDE